MDEETRKKLKAALENGEGFLEFLRQGAQSADYQKLKTHLEQGPHPTREMLYDYVLNWTDEIVDEKIMDHMAYCPICAKEVLSIIGIENELEAEMVDWASQMPLLERLKGLVSNLSMPVYSFLAGSHATRGEVEKSARTQYRINESIVFCVPIDSDGYLVILHYDESKKVSMVFPARAQDNTFVGAGTEKKIAGKVTEPSGRHSFKVIWTSSQLIEPDEIDFNDEDEKERAINEFLDALTELNEGEWEETEYGFEVSED